MSRVRARGETIRRFILEHVDTNPRDISKMTAQHFGITRQAVNKHIRRLSSEGALTEDGHTRSRSYKLSPLVDWVKTYGVVPELAEDIAWTEVANALGQQPDNVLDIWQYGFTEMFNNARDHSEGNSIMVRVKKDAVKTEVMVSDDGVGIFRKIQRELNLLDERHAILELSKGKLTTDPKHHTGEGVFFTSRMFDSFQILSGGCFLTHTVGNPEDWLLESQGTGGTFVFMRLSNHTARTTKAVFDEYTSGEDYGFSKTVVPVQLAQYGNDKLISRSQAKRVLARVELFLKVVFDFQGVRTIGLAFADEIFRVFADEHPGISLIPINMVPEVDLMVKRAQFARTTGQSRAN